MSNTLELEATISKSTQKYLSSSPVFSKLASFQENNTLSRGVTVNRPYRGDFAITPYTAHTDVPVSDWSLTNQLLTVDRSFAASIRIDPVEQRRTAFDLASEFAPRLAYQLGNRMDRDFLDEVHNAALDLDASDFGGASGAPIDLTTTTAEKVWSSTFAELVGNADEYDKGLYAVVDAKMVSEIQQRGINTGFTISDMIYRNGMTNSSFLGFDLVVSKNLPSEATFTLANAIPAANDTVTILGVPFTFKTTLGATAGTVLSETSVTQTAQNLADAINAAATAGSKYIELSKEYRDRLTAAGVTATVAAGVVTVKAYGRMTLAKSFATSANGVWGEQTIHSMVGQRGAVDMVVQMQPQIQVNKAVNNLGSTIIGHALWGVKTFNDGAQRMCRIAIKA